MSSVARVKKPQTRVKRRYVYLIQDLLKKEGSHRAVAAKLGVERSYVTKMLDGDRGDGDVGGDLVDCAIKNLKIDPWYFFADYRGDRSYELYLLEKEGDASVDAEIVRRLTELIRGGDRGMGVALKRPKKSSKGGER